jgi:hypothetical protein
VLGLGADLREILQLVQLDPVIRYPLLANWRQLNIGVGFLFTNLFSIFNRPASSSFVRWLDRLTTRGQAMHGHGVAAAFRWAWPLPTRTQARAASATVD